MMRLVGPPDCNGLGRAARACRCAQEQRAAQRLPPDRETLPLAIREPETAAAEHLVKDSVLLAEVLDRVLLTAVQEILRGSRRRARRGAGAAHRGSLSGAPWATPSGWPGRQRRQVCERAWELRFSVQSAAHRRAGQSQLQAMPPCFGADRTSSTDGADGAAAQGSGRSAVSNPRDGPAPRGGRRKGLPVAASSP